MNQLSSSVMFRCDKCFALIEGESAFLNHLSTLHFDYYPYRCGYCAETGEIHSTTTEDKMKHHLETIHRVNDLKISIHKKHDIEIQLRAIVDKCRLRTENSPAVLENAMRHAYDVLDEGSESSIRSRDHREATSPLPKQRGSSVEASETSIDDAADMIDTVDPLPRLKLEEAFSVNELMQNCYNTLSDGTKKDERCNTANGTRIELASKMESQREKEARSMLATPHRRQEKLIPFIEKDGNSNEEKSASAAQVESQSLPSKLKQKRKRRKCPFTDEKGQKKRKICNKMPIKSEAANSENVNEDIVNVNASDDVVDSAMTASTDMKTSLKQKNGIETELQMTAEKCRVKTENSPASLKSALQQAYNLLNGERRDSSIERSELTNGNTSDPFPRLKLEDGLSMRELLQQCYNILSDETSVEKSASAAQNENQPLPSKLKQKRKRRKCPFTDEKGRKKRKIGNKMPIKTEVTYSEDANEDVVNANTDYANQNTANNVFGYEFDHTTNSATIAATDPENTQEKSLETISEQQIEITEESVSSNEPADVNGAAVNIDMDDVISMMNEDDTSSQVGENSLKCTFCSFTGSHERVLKRHLSQAHIKTTLLKCQHCFGSWEVVLTRLRRELNPTGGAERRLCWFIEAEIFTNPTQYWFSRLGRSERSERDPA
ncbi:hypothetical protein DdX_20142 [Ditylenchus destructor]|uniref:C2H2-type domain-containing protein n=1 Tax=Ditylenchus destructor TaxID=166010 RepID=A0AAD4MH50_9BILA|nr:hypothetical protein DdX_20142 [Ditylenchus destructor]